MKDILALGECMLEYRFAPDSPEPLKSIGGDTFNTLAMAVELGLEGSYFMAWNRDKEGEYLYQRMNDCGVDLSLLQEIEGKNASYTIRTDEAGERSFTYDRAGSVTSLVDEKSFPFSELKNYRMFFSTGISQAISPSCRELVQSCFEKACSENIATGYDVNFRGNLWSLEEASLALSKLLPFIKILFYSEEEKSLVKRSLENISGESIEEKLFHLGIDVVVEKNGAKGAIVNQKGKASIEIPAPCVQAVDTTGAGDIFNGAFLASWLREKDLTKAGVLAAKAAALQVTRRGAIEALPRKDEIESFKQD